MKDVLNSNRYSNLKATRRLLVFLLAMYLPVSSLFAQERRSIASGDNIGNDTLRIDLLISTAKKWSVPPDSALHMLNEAATLSKKHGLQKRTALAWGLMAGRKLQTGNFEECKQYLDSAFALNEQLKDGELTCILNTAAAGMYQYSSQYAKAASHYFRAMEAVQEYKLGNTRPGLILYINLSELMFQLGEDSLSRTYLLQAKRNALDMHPVDSGVLTVILLNLAQTYLSIDSSSSINHYKEASHLANKINNVTYSYMILINLTQSYIAQKQYDSAQHYLQLARDIAEPGITSVQTEYIAGLLSFNKKDYATALKQFHTALKLTEGEDYEYLDAIYKGLASTYAAHNQYAKAYEFHIKYLQQYEKRIGDSKEILADFMLSFQSSEHEKTMMQKQAEIIAKETAIKKRNLWIGTTSLLSVLFCVILVMAYRNYRNRKILLNERMQALLQDQEIERLKAEAEGEDKERSRIAYDLHDGVLVRLANVKMNIAGLPVSLPEFAENSRYQDIVTQLDMATRELRNTAHNLMPEILLEDGLAQAIFYFCKATEQASGLSIKFQQVGSTFPRLQPEVETAVYRIVQGLIQNIIQHAGATSSLVQLQYADNLCSVTVEDNGQGIDTLKADEGYGLKSIRNRIKILKGSFDIESEKEQGTTIYFEFDVRPFLHNPVVNHPSHS